MWDMPFGTSQGRSLPALGATCGLLLPMLAQIWPRSLANLRGTRLAEVELPHTPVLAHSVLFEVTARVPAPEWAWGPGRPCRQGSRGGAWTDVA